MTITYHSGSIVAYLPLQNITSDYLARIRAARSVHLAALLPADAGPSILVHPHP